MTLTMSREIRQEESVLRLAFRSEVRTTQASIHVNLRTTNKPSTSKILSARQYDEYQNSHLEVTWLRRVVLMKAGEPWARPESAAIMARSSSEAADLILLTKDAKIRLVRCGEGQTYYFRKKSF